MPNTVNTRYGADKINKFLERGNRLFFVGIGGINMCSLAVIAARRGFAVTGSDKSDSEVTRGLMLDGINVISGHSRENIIGGDGEIKADMLIYTVSVPTDNPEYAAAGEAGIPRVSRADFLGWLMHDYRHRIGISGMHGKSTTTGMAASILLSADCNPTISSGAVMPQLGRSYRAGDYNDGQNEYFLYEACEYKDSFLSFYPTVSVILNIDMDHPDYFPDLDAIKTSFRKNLALVRDFAVVNWSDANVREVCDCIDGSKLIKFGTELDGADSEREPAGRYDFYARDINLGAAQSCFTIYKHGEPYAKITLHDAGLHNVRNAVAAAAAADAAGIPVSAVCYGLESFTGAARRMEFICKTAAGADVYSDYAHHPTEIAATLDTARRLGGRLVCVFQPHAYTRLRALFDGFASALSRCDAVILADVYGARETDTLGVGSALLADAVNGAGGNALYLGGDFGKIADYVSSPAVAGAGDTVVVMGAGNINSVLSYITRGDMV